MGRAAPAGLASRKSKTKIRVSGKGKYMIPCLHKWESFAEPIGDDLFERCEKCEVIHTTKKHPMNLCRATQKTGRSNYEDMGLLVGGILQGAFYTEIHLPWFQKIDLNNPWGKGRLLEVGCGPGPFVPQFSAWGWKITCLEIDPWANQFLTQTFFPLLDGVHKTDLFQTCFRQFDAIVSCHSLEHFVCADQAFAFLADSLSPGGRLYIEVPGQEDIYVWDHFWHLNQTTLETWAKNCGLVNVQVDPRRRRQPNCVVTDWNLTARKP
jgi:SAM-dependent methyltransferase